MAIPIKQKMTINEFDEFVFHPDHIDHDYEFIGGEIFEVVSNNYSSQVAALITVFVGAFIVQNKLGQVTSSDGGYQIAGDRYIPDFAYISYKRQPKPSHDAYNPNPPDLAVEVISPTDSEKSIRVKVVNYLAENVVVWVVNPTEKTVEVYQPAKSVIVLGFSDMIDGGTVLEGFRLPVKDIFPPEEFDDSTETST